jgi:multidrug resistance efflux pump
VSKEKKTMKKTAVVLALVLAFALAMMAGCSTTSPAAAGPIGVKTAAATQKSMETELSVAGVIVPSQTITISSKVSGEVTAVNTEAGAAVKAGDELLTIDQKTLATQLEQAQAQLKAAQASATAATKQASATAAAVKAAKGQAAVAKINRDALQKAYDAMKALVDAGAATQAQLDDIQTKLDVAKAQYTAANSGTVNQAKSAAEASASSIDAAQANVEVVQANIKLLQLQLANTSVKTPIGGVVVTRNINVGEMAAAGSPLLTVADTGTLKLKGTVPQEALPLLKVGQEMAVTVDIYPGKSFTGKITLLGPMAVTTGEYFPIEVSLSNDGSLQAGLSAHAAVKVKTDAAVAVPNTAIVKGNSQSYVFLVKDGAVSKRAVTTGLSNNTDTEILSGLNAGEQVAVTNTASLEDGMPVTVAAQ